MNTICALGNTNGCPQYPHCPCHALTSIQAAAREVERSGEFAGFSNTELLTAFRMPWSTAAREKLRVELLARGVDPYG